MYVLHAEPFDIAQVNPRLLRCFVVCSCFIMLLPSEQQDDSSAGYEVNMVDLVVLLEDPKYLARGVPFDGKPADGFVFAVKRVQPPESSIGVCREMTTITT